MKDEDKEADLLGDKFSQRMENIEFKHNRTDKKLQNLTDKLQVTF